MIGLRHQLSLFVLWIAGPAVALAGVAGDVTGAPAAESAPLVSIRLYPEAFTLDAGGGSHRFLVSGARPDGVSVDLTSPSTPSTLSISVDPPGIATLSAEGAALVPGSPGEGVLTVRHGDLVTTAAIVTREPAARPMSFENDILPLLSRAGCNAGECHAKASGQAGFKLSVFAYDPKSDYSEIVKDARGRRVFPAAPDQSLVLLKPTQGVQHGGGKRFEIGSPTYKTLEKWIASGLPVGAPEEPKLERVRVFPPEGLYDTGAEQPLIVQGLFSDGGVRDVTALAHFSSNNPELVSVDDAGRMRVGTISGESVVVARYMGLVDVSRVASPMKRTAPEALFAASPPLNAVDKFVQARLRRLGLAPSPPCDDATFLRRASLDVIGALPTVAEAEAFLADNSPDKRAALIDRLLDDPRYADFWATKWADLMRPNPARVGVKSVYVFDHWIRQSLRENKPYDQFVREIITATGTTHRDGPTVVFRDRSDPPLITTLVSQLFLGVRMECAKCHHHPNEKWSQQDFYQLAAFFGEVGHKGTGISPPISGSVEYIFHRPGGKVTHPVTGETMKPTPPEGKPAEIATGADPRRALADWMTAPDNPFFARAIVNRVWADLLGRGIVEPVDDFRASNPPTNPELLDWLAQDFVRGGFDLKKLIKTITSSQTYQADSNPIPENVNDTENFARSYRRRLRAEPLLDAVSDLTESPQRLDGLPGGVRALETWSNNIASDFMDAFGRPDSSQDCTCERDPTTSLVQALHLMNSDRVQGQIANDNGRAARLAKDPEKSMKDIIRELYLAAYSRPPTEEELASTSALLFEAPGADRRSATEDIMWALINSAEFVFNH